MIQQSTALLNLDELLEAIVESGAKINSNYLERLDEKESYNVNGVAIRNGAYMDFKVLVSVIEASYSISTDDEQREQLVQLSLSINENLKDFRTLLRSRTTKRRNKKDVEIAVKELINDLSVGESEEKVVKDLSVEVDDTLNELEEVELAGGEELPMTCVAPAKHKCTKPELRMSQLRGAGTPYSQQEILAP